MENQSNFSASNNKRMSDDIRALCKAFIEAKKLFTATGLDAENPHHKSKYAKLDAIYQAVEPGLLSNGIAIWHFRDIEEGREILYTRLTHELTGQYIEDKAFLESQKPGNQEKGSACTYMKKYAVLNLCAIHQGEDDDGQEEAKHIAAQEQQNNKPSTNNAPKKEFVASHNNPSSANQHKFIKDLCNQKKSAAVDELLNGFEIFDEKDYLTLTQLDAKNLIDELKKL